ncbi:hypothetical protein [uncultured Sphingomonas sp.]|jgi:hypothetical protein|uniref:hypothetical protein n=1 Tax=uncultured Sphingomonas sp. TaxID=158754 RepID=UPI0035CA2CDE
MNESNTGSYFARREQKEREQAARATDPRAAAIHNDLADNYARLARQQMRPRLSIV